MSAIAQYQKQSLKTLLENKKVATVSPNASFGKLFLSFAGKDSGEWKLSGEGQNGPVNGEVVILNPYSIQHGYILWFKQKATKAFSHFTQELPQIIPPMGDVQAKEARLVEGRFIDSDVEFIFDSCSMAGVESINNIIKIVEARVQTEETYVFPVVQLSNSSYDNEKFGCTIFIPVFEQIGWSDFQGNLEHPLEIALEEPVVVETPEPKKAVVKTRKF